MHPYPHTYVASASAQKAGLVTVTSPQLPDLKTAPPPQFGGPGDVWSPESLLCASLADCFILTFRAISGAARLEWLHLECRVEGVLDWVERVSKFARYRTHATLTLRAGASVEKARDLLAQAEYGCLIANSLQGDRELEVEIIVIDQ